MASGSFHVSPTGIAGEAATFSTAGSDVNKALSTLEAALNGSATAIGHDKPGNSFAAQYLPDKEKILAGIRTLVKGLDSIDPAVKAMAANYKNADATNNQIFGGH